MNHIPQAQIGTFIPYTNSMLIDNLLSPLTSSSSSSPMAASSTFCNLLSFILPTKQSPQPKTPPPLPPNLNLPPSSSTPFPSQTQKLSHNLEPLISKNDDPSSSSSSLSSDLSSVMCPSLAYANTLFFKSAYNVQVVVGDDEPEERLLNRFRREVMKAGVIQETKRRRYFENKQDEKKRKSREAAKRNRRRRPQPRTPMQNKEDVPATKKQEDDDNWDLPEGDTVF